MTPEGTLLCLSIVINILLAALSRCRLGCTSFCYIFVYLKFGRPPHISEWKKFWAETSSKYKQDGTDEHGDISNFNISNLVILIMVNSNCAWLTSSITMIEYIVTFPPATGLSHSVLIIIYP